MFEASSLRKDSKMVKMALFGVLFLFLVGCAHSGQNLCAERFVRGLGRVYEQNEIQQEAPIGYTARK